MRLIEYGDIVMLAFDRNNRWIVKIRQGKKMHTHAGNISFDEIVGKRFGSSIFTSLQKKALILRPLWRDAVNKMAHTTQVIYPKDAGLIASYAHIVPGTILLEAGCGSGSLTSWLSLLVGEHGHVYARDNRQSSLERARKNVKAHGRIESVSFQEEDVSEGIALEDRSVDVIVFDFPTPWLSVKHAHRVLRDSGMLCCFLPTTNQIEKTAIALKEGGFGAIEAMEAIQRDLQIKRDAIRPMTRMIGHTGYLLFARKLTE